MDDFPLSEIRKKLTRLRGSDGWQRLGSATHWYEVMLRGREGPLRRFL
jgi:hypothetical protein